MKTWRDIEHLGERTALQTLLEEEKTPLRIARRLGCSRESVKNAMKHHGLSTKKYRIGDDMKKKLRL